MFFPRRGVDQHGRMLAVCTAGPEQLNQVMVEQGWAVAYRQYSDAYVGAELSAKSDHLGIGYPRSCCLVSIGIQNCLLSLRFVGA